MIKDYMHFVVNIFFGKSPQTFRIKITGERGSLDELSIAGIENFDVETLKDIITKKSNEYYNNYRSFDMDVILDILIQVFTNIRKEVDIHVREFEVSWKDYTTVVPVRIGYDVV